MTNDVPAVVEGDDGGTKEPANKRVRDGGGEGLARINDMRSWSNVVLVAEAGFRLQQMIIIIHVKYHIVREKHTNRALDFVLKGNNIAACRMVKAVERSYIRAMGKDETRECWSLVYNTKQA